MTEVPRQLFGGAAQVFIPARFVDVSGYRDVPDHQEVFTDGAEDQSLVIEILEYQTIEDEQSGLFFTKDLAAQSAAAACTVESSEELGPDAAPGAPAEVYKSLTVSTQLVAKGRQGIDAANQVQVMLANIRLPKYGTDLTFVLNTPMYVSADSSAAEHTGAGHKSLHLSSRELFLAILASFEIKDYSLFGEAAGDVPS